MAVTRIDVAGPACGVCLAALLDELRVVDGVSGASAGLGSGGATVAVAVDVPGLTPQLHDAVGRAGFTVRHATVRSARRDLEDVRPAARAAERAHHDNGARGGGMER